MRRWVAWRKSAAPSSSPWQTIRDAIDQEDLLSIRKGFAKWPEELANNKVLGCPLSYACQRSGLPVIELILSLGADINLRDSLDFSPLNGACYEGRVEVVKYLLLNGAEIDVSTARRNPLFDCVRGGAYGGQETGENERFRKDTLECAKVLIEHGIELVTLYNTQAMVDMDVAAQAWMYGHRDITYLIIERLYGHDKRLAASALAEAVEVSWGNATSRQKFRRRRYPPRRGKNAGVKPLEGEYWSDEI
jgi:uncharacterized protein